MYYMRGDKPLEEHEIGLGRQKGDGYSSLRDADTRHYRDLLGATGAGVYTVRPVSKSNFMGHEPYFLLYNGKTDTSQAIHSPANQYRASLLDNQNAKDNRVSYGCIYPEQGVMRRWYDDKMLQRGDTVYILPEEQGNYMYETPQGKIAMYFSPFSPLTYTAKDGRVHGIHYNTSQ